MKTHHHWEVNCEFRWVEPPPLLPERWRLLRHRIRTRVARILHALGIHSELDELYLMWFVADQLRQEIDREIIAAISVEMLNGLH